jgi:hypothetical protein
MIWAAKDIDYVAELLSVRSTYVGMSARQRLAIIRLRLADHHFGANRLVTSVSAVEALARSLAMGLKAKSKAELGAIYSKYKDRAPKTLVAEYFAARGVTNLSGHLGQDTWRLFGYAVDYRNMLAHECTYLGQDKFPSLIEACEEVLSALVKLGRVPEPRT